VAEHSSATFSKYRDKMKKFLVKIHAYKYYAKFEVLAEDNVESIENSIVDKLGDKSIKWEYLGEMMDPRVRRITYEEVVDGQRPIQTKKILGVEVAAGV
jgi:aminopeptidase C